MTYTQSAGTEKALNCPAGARVTRAGALSAREAQNWHPSGLRSHLRLRGCRRTRQVSRKDALATFARRDRIVPVDSRLGLEAIVIPENFKAIRALAGSASAAESIGLSNETLGIARLQLL